MLLEVRGQPDPEHIHVKHVGTAPAEPMTEGELREAQKPDFQGTEVFGPVLGRFVYGILGRFLLNRYVKDIQRQSGEGVPVARITVFTPQNHQEIPPTENNPQ